MLCQQLTASQLNCGMFLLKLPHASLLGICQPRTDQPGEWKTSGTSSRRPGSVLAFMIVVLLLWHRSFFACLQLEAAAEQGDLQETRRLFEELGVDINAK